MENDFKTPELILPKVPSENDINANIEKQKDDLLQTAEYFYHAFKSPTGKKVLELLKSCTIDISVLDVQISDANGNMNPNEFVFMREGQNQIIRFIEQQIKIYKNRNK